MKISRVWAMPSSDTFTIKPIMELLERRISEFPEGIFIDPFVRNSPFKSLCISNDIDDLIEADYHMDALDFLKEIETDSADLIFYDPPYSVRQVSECYRALGRTVNSETTRSSFWSNLKTECKRITRKGGVVISFGWNSGGIGKTNGFDIEEILLVPHGGIHNDTICTVERKYNTPELF